MTRTGQQGPEARVAVVGTGALGSEFCRLLLAAKHPNVLLVDPDELQAHNVALSPLFRDAQALGEIFPGVAKVEVLRRMAERQGLAWDVLPVEIADAGWLDLRGCDLLVCCADSVLARVETAGAARSLGLPMFEAAVAANGLPQGRAAFFPGDRAHACYLCGLSEQRRAEVLAYALSPSLGCLPGEEFPGMTGRQDFLRVVAAELFRLFRGAPSSTAFAVRLDVENGARERLALPRGAGCPWHELPLPESLLTLPYDEPVATTLADEADPTVLELFWPICLRTRCRACGHLAPAASRAALLRRRGVCSACSLAGSLEPLECVACFKPNDAAAMLTPRQLGLPQRHLYSKRPAIVRGQLE